MLLGGDKFAKVMMHRDAISRFLCFYLFFYKRMESRRAIKDHLIDIDDVNFSPRKIIS